MITREDNRDIIESSAVMRLAKRIYNAAFSGFFGTAASDYSNSERLFENGFIGGKSNTNGEKNWSRSFLSRTRHSIIVSLEGSGIRHALTSFADFLLSAGCKFYGFFFLYFGLSVLLMNLIKRFAFESDVSNGSAWFFGVLFLVISLPLLISRKYLGEALSDGKIFSFVLFDVLGISKRRLKLHRENDSAAGHYFRAALVGTLLGCASYFISPAIILAVSFLLLLFILVVNCPLSGVLMTVLFAPVAMASGIAPEYTLIPVICTFLSLLRKVFLGKIIFRFEISDFFTGLFLVFTVLGGIITYGGGASCREALLLGGFLLFYFVTVALITTRDRLARIISCASASAALSLVICAVRPLASGIENGDAIINIIINYGERLSESLGDPYSYGVFLTLALPFFILGALGEKRTASKLAFLVFAAISVIGLALYGSASTQAGLIISLVIFIFLYRYTAIPLVIPTLLLSAVIISDRGEGVLSLAASRFDASPHVNRIEARFDIWKQAFAVAKKGLFSGAGVGNDALAAAFSSVTSSGAAINTNCQSQYVEYLVELGIPGLFLFLASVSLIFRSGLELLRGSEWESKTERGACVAGISGMSALLAEGLINCVFSEPTVFFAFFAVAAITSSAARIARKRTLADLEY